MRSAGLRIAVLVVLWARDGAAARLAREGPLSAWLARSKAFIELRSESNALANGKALDAATALAGDEAKAQSLEQLEQQAQQELNLEGQALNQESQVTSRKEEETQAHSQEKIEANATASDEDQLTAQDSEIDESLGGEKQRNEVELEDRVQEEQVEANRSVSDEEQLEAQVSSALQETEDRVDESELRAQTGDAHAQKSRRDAGALLKQDGAHKSVHALSSTRRKVRNTATATQGSAARDGDDDDDVEESSLMKAYSQLTSQSQALLKATEQAPAQAQAQRKLQRSDVDAPGEDHDFDTLHQDGEARDDDADSGNEGGVSVGSALIERNRAHVGDDSDGNDTEESSLVKAYAESAVKSRALLKLTQQTPEKPLASRSADTGSLHGDDDDADAEETSLLKAYSESTRHQLG